MNSRYGSGGQEGVTSGGGEKGKSLESWDSFRRKCIVWVVQCGASEKGLNLKSGS